MFGAALLLFAVRLRPAAGTGSAASALLSFAPLLAAILFFTAADRARGAFSAVCFVLDAGCFALFIIQFGNLVSELADEFKTAEIARF